jgi:hypothetical protein
MRHQLLHREVGFPKNTDFVGLKVGFPPAEPRKPVRSGKNNAAGSVDHPSRADVPAEPEM